MTRFTLCLCGLLLAASAAADGPTGTEILQRCEYAAKQVDGVRVTDTEAALGIWCLGYLQGMTDGILAERAIQSRSALSHMRVCLPNTVRLNQLSQLIVADFKTKQSALEGSGAALVVHTLARYFPCK